jgi:hypothetical protein
MGVAHSKSFTYAEIRPIPSLHTPHHLPITADCSGFVTICYAWAGAPDPNGNDYSGEGFTGTLLRHCEVVVRQPEVGDLVVLGPGSGSHVVLIVDLGPPITVVSHGHPGDPEETTLAFQISGFPPPVRFIRCSGVWRNATG